MELRMIVVAGLIAIASAFIREQAIVTKIVKLNHSDHLNVALFTDQQGLVRAAIGCSKGLLRIIDIQSGLTIYTISQLTNSIRQIIPYKDGGIFARDIKNVIMVDQDGRVKVRWHAKQLLIGISVSQNRTGFGYLVVVYRNAIFQSLFPTDRHNISEDQIDSYGVNFDQIDSAIYSPGHLYLYASNNKNQLIVFQANRQQQTEEIQQIRQINQYQSIQKLLVNRSAGVSKSRELKKRGIVLKRAFNFDIKALLTDTKDQSGHEESLILISSDNVIYYTKKGNIITYLPYKQKQSDQLLLYCYCESQYFLTLHKNKEDFLFYLTFFDKKTHLKEKILSISLNQTKEIISMDCNHQNIALLTQQSIVIIKNWHQKEEMADMFVSIMQWSITAFLLLLFVCCCRKGHYKQVQIQQFLQQIDQEQEMKESAQQRQNTDDKSSQSSRQALKLIAASKSSGKRKSKRKTN